VLSVQSRKGQVTVFIIFGILLLLAVTAFYLFRGRERAISGPPELAPVPLEAQPVHAFVTECLRNLAEDGLRRIGDSGGYIDPVASGLSGNPGQPTQGSAIPFAPGSDLLIAQWWHMAGDDDCTGSCPFASKRPNLYKAQGEPSIEGQLERFIESGLQGCTAGFTQFAKEGFEIQELGRPEVNATIAESTVFFVLSHPLAVSRAGSAHDVKDYVVEFDLPLRDIYLLASNITSAQAENRYLENAMRQIIDGFAGADRNRLPPTSEFIVDLGLGVIWTKYDVEQKLTHLLEQYIPMVQVLGVRNYRFIDPKSQVRDPDNFRTLYNYGFTVPLERLYPDLEAKHTYLGWWKPYFDLNCRGQLCMPESVLGTLGFIFGFQQYSFAYDISAPVLLEVSAPDAFNRRGYSFRFFLEANMRTNAPMPTEYNPIYQLDIFGGSLLCNREQWTSDNVTVTALDARGKKPVPEAQVSFRCGGETCIAGTTGTDGTLVTPLPPCLGGIIGAEKLEMHPAYKRLDTNVDGGQERTLILEPIRYLNASVMKYQLKKSVNAWVLDTINPVSQRPDEYTIVALKREPVDALDPPFTSFVLASGNRAADDFDTDIPFLPGTYALELMTIKEAKPAIRILPNRRCFRATGGSRKCFNIPETPIEFNATNPFPAGFATIPWEIGAGELDSGRHIKFFTVSAALDLVPESRRRIEDLDVMGKTRDYAAESAAAFRPVIEP
jgi:hypothetical protein